MVTALMSSSANDGPGSYSPLSRGLACLACRRRKQKCGGGATTCGFELPRHSRPTERPYCVQCTERDRVHECHYDPKPQTEEERLEARIQELEILIDRHGSGPRPPGSLSNRHSHPSLAITFNASQSVSADLVGHLLEVFLANAYVFDFPIAVPTFRASLQYPTGHSKYPHPALINAMCLLACRFSPRNLVPYETHFLTVSWELLDHSLAYVDRLLDFIIATTLVSRHCFAVGQDTCGGYLATSAVTFSMACGLHALPADIRARGISDETYLLPPMESPADLDTRIHVWWSVFLLDREASTIVGLTSSLAEESISTPQPNLFAIFENASTSSLPRTAVLSSNEPAKVLDEMLIFFKAKASGLLFQSAKQARKYLRGEFDAFWRDQHTINTSLDSFTQSLPPVTFALGSSNTHQPRDKQAIYNTLVFAHSYSLASKINLNSVIASSPSSAEYRIMVQAAQSLAVIVRAAGPIDARNTSFFVAPTWAMGLQVLSRELQRIKDAHYNSEAIQNDINCLTSALNALVGLYPSIRSYLTGEAYSGIFS